MTQRGIDRAHVPSYFTGAGIAALTCALVVAPSARAVVGAILLAVGIIGLCWRVHE